MGIEELAAPRLTAVGSNDLWLILTQVWCDYNSLFFTVYKKNTLLKTVVTVSICGILLL
jgi:hypothetical protein